MRVDLGYEGEERSSIEERWSTEAVKGKPMERQMPSIHAARTDTRLEDAFRDFKKRQNDQAWRYRRKSLEKYGILPSRIVLAAIGVTVVMQELAGLSVPLGFSELNGSPSYPDQGDCFKDGLQDFTEFDGLLQEAFPVTWEGP